MNSGGAGAEVGPGGLGQACEQRIQRWRRGLRGMGSQSDGGWGEDSLTAAKCRGREEGR